MDPALPAGVTMSRHLHRGRTVMQIVRIRLDLAKYVFEIHGVDAHGKTVVRKTFAVMPYQRFSQTCRRALSAWKPRTAHTFGRRRFWTLAMMSD